VIQITPNIALDDREIQESFVRAQGPGGQNVNKVATAVQLRFDVAHSVSLPDDVRQRLISLAGNAITEDGILMIEARRFRTQGRNREDAIDRLVAMVREAAEPPPIRYKTRPSLGAKIRRLESKRRGSEIKSGRGPIHPTSD
jgi:ribosome-associated protein